MIAAALILTAALAALVLLAKHHGDRVIEEIHAAELRQIHRERLAKQHAANLSARWRG